MTTINRQISYSAGDAREISGGTVTLTDVSIVLSSGAHWAGAFYSTAAGAYPPPGVTIGAATFWIYINATANDNVYGDFYFEKNTVSPVDFTTGTSNISARPRTTAKTTVSANNVGAGWYGINMATPLQELVNDPNYDGSMCVIWDAAAACDVIFRTYDYNSTLAPKLDITYSSPPISATAADGLNFTASVPRRGIYRKTVSDSLEVAPSPTRRAIYRKATADALKATDAPGRRGIYRKTAVDSPRYGAALTPRRVLRSTVVESLGLVSSMSKKASFKPSVTGLLDLLETMTGSDHRFAAVTDAVDVAETLMPRYLLRRTAADTLRLIPTLTRRADYRTTVTQVWSLGDAALLPVPVDSGSIDIGPYEDSSQGSNAVINIGNNEQACRAGDPWNALEFRDIDAPRYAIPTAAYLNLYVITNDDPGLTIHLQKTESPAALTTTASDISSRTPLTTGVAWSAANIGTGYKPSPDFSDDLAEVFALAGWTRGTSDLVVILHDNGTGGYLRYGTSEHSDTAKRPHLIIEWYIGGLTITATAADTIELLEDISRREIVAAATQDAVSLAAAAATAISLVVADRLRLTETINVLARLTVGDNWLLGENVHFIYALSLTEPVDFIETISAIAALRAAPVDALDYIETVRTKVSTAAGDAVTLTDGLIARWFITGIAADAARYQWFVTGDIAGILEAIATDTLRLPEALLSGWTARVELDDAVDIDASVTAVRVLLAAAADVGALGDIATLLRKMRPTVTDAADFAESLNALMRTRAADTFHLSDDTITRIAFVLYALAADVLAFDDGMVTNWKVTARDTMEFVSTIAAVMHWVEEVQDALGLSGVAVFLLPNGIVRIEFAINAVTVQFDVAMPRADMTLIQPTVSIIGHGLLED